MKIIIISILLFFTAKAQTVWYVNTELTTGAGNGTSWTDAWRFLDSADLWDSNRNYGVNWHDISAGDTIYISGGTDSVIITPDYYPEPIYESGIMIGVSSSGLRSHTFAPGNPVIICPGKDAGHNGRVVFSSDPDDVTIAQVIRLMGLCNIKFVGFEFRNNQDGHLTQSGTLNIGPGQPPSIDSLITFENCHFYSYGAGGTVNISSTKVTFTKCIFETTANEYATGQDPITANGGWGGHVIDSCKIIMRHTYEIIDDENLLDGTGMTVTDTSLTDTDLSMVTDYHTQNSVWVNGYYLQLTGNSSNTFYGTEWVFDPITGSDSTQTVYTTTRLTDNSSESYNANTLVGAYIITSYNDTMLITSNSGHNFDGTAWYPNTPDSWNGRAYRIVGGDKPANGQSWSMGGAHNDGIQISNLGYETGAPYPMDRMTLTFSNNFIYAVGALGTGWNNIIYNYGWIDNPDLRITVYNNIFVNEKIHTGIGNLAFGRYYLGSTYTEFNSVYILNNTFISKGSDGGMLTTWCIDTLVMKNNLFIKDSTSSNIFNLENTAGYWNASYKDINYNRYGVYGGSPAVFAVPNGSNYTFSEWQGLDNTNGSGIDSASNLVNSTGITFTDKYSESIADYYTTTGRDSGADLSATYPFLSTDILGNERTGSWDIGALEYFTGATVDSTPSNVSLSADYLTAELDSQYQAHIYNLADFDSGYARIDRGWYKVDNSDWKPYTEWTMVYPLNDIDVRDTSSTEYSTTQTITLTIGDASDTWTLRTKDQPSASGKRLVQPNGRLIFASDGITIIPRTSTYIPPAEPDTIAPAKPTSLVATGQNTTDINIVWDNPVDADSIYLYEGTTNDTTAMSLLIRLGAVESYLRTGLSAETTRWYAVKAIDDSGNVSYFSNTNDGTTTASEGGEPLANLDFMYLSNSFARHIYDHEPEGGASDPTIQEAMTAYNTDNELTGEDAGTVSYPPADYPACGDMIWHWNQVFFGGSAFSNTQNIITTYANTSTYDILQVTFGFNSAGLIDYIGLDTVNYGGVAQTVENYKYWIRNMVAAMELHPDKYWILWNIPPVVVGTGVAEADVNLQADFNTWMVDTLQAGLDSYGTFPTNVYIFDVFSLLKNSGNNWMNDDYADGEEDSHPNAAGASYVAPILIQEVFDKARAYRIPD